MRRALAAAAVVALAATSGCSATPDHDGTVRGRVTSQLRSAPPAHCLLCPDTGVVSVYATSSRTGRAVATASTTASGNYELHVRPGTYYLGFTFGGPSADRGTAGPSVVVSTGHAVTANITTS